MEKKCFVRMQLTKYKFNSMTIIENKYSYLNIKQNYDRASPSNNLVCLSSVFYIHFCLYFHGVSLL